MYINAFYKEKIEGVDKDVAVGKNRAIYYADLYRAYQKVLYMNIDKKIYSYEFLSKRLIQNMPDIVKKNKYDWIMFPHYFHHWNDGYAVPEFYLKKTYGFSGNFLDIRDCGTLCIYQALFLLKKLNASGLVLSIESDQVLNQYDYVGFLEINTNGSKSQLRIKDIIFLSLEKNLFLEKEVKEFLLKNNVTLEEVIIFSHADYHYDFYSGFFYEIVTYLTLCNVKIHKKYILVQDKDLDSNRQVLMLIEFFI